jgi:hypothetical protein
MEAGSQGSAESIASIAAAVVLIADGDARMEYESAVE